MNKKKEGFSLVELLATLLIISVVLGIGGYFIINTINRSKEKSLALSDELIKKSASLYNEEFSDNVIWNHQDGSDEQIACIPVYELINKGYIKESQIENNNNLGNSYIRLTRDDTKAIISEEVDDGSDENSICSRLNKKVAIPTAKTVCMSSEYTGEEIDITGQPTVDYEYDILSGEDGGEYPKKDSSTGQIVGIESGNYNIIVKLKEEGNVWIDNTKKDKTVNCKIEKATPTLKLDSYNIESPVTSGTYNTKLTSNVEGTINLKTSNKNYAYATFMDGESNRTQNNEGGIFKDIIINTPFTRKQNTYITITLTPDDSNYKEASIIYTIGKIEAKTVKKPVCNLGSSGKINYTGYPQSFVALPYEGYTLNPVQAVDPGNYQITATLEPGYRWDDKTISISPYTFNCEIENPNITVTYNPNGGTACNPTSKTVNLKNKYGTLCSNTTKSGYQLLGWKDEYGKGITANTLVSINRNHTLTAIWSEGNIYEIGLNCQNCTTSGTTAFYEKYGNGFYFDAEGTNSLTTINKPTKTGHTFLGYYTADSGGEQIIDANGNLVSGVSNTKFTKNTTLYAQYRINKIYVQFHVNGGKLDPNPNTSDGGTKISQSGDYILINGNQNAASYDYGKTDINLADPNYSGYINIVKSGWTITHSEAWINISTNIKYSDAGGVSASSLCDASKTDCIAKLKVNWIDKTSPTCGTITGASSTWTNQNRTITVSCNDSGIGCAVSSYSRTFSSGTTKTSSITIYDKSGNSRKCTFNVYVDKDKPYAPYFNTNDSTNKYGSEPVTNNGKKAICFTNWSGCSKTKQTNNVDDCSLKKKNTCGGTLMTREDVGNGEIGYAQYRVRCVNSPMKKYNKWTEWMTRAQFDAFNIQLGIDGGCRITKTRSRTVDKAGNVGPYIQYEQTHTYLSS